MDGGLSGKYLWHEREIRARINCKHGTRVRSVLVALVHTNHMLPDTEQFFFFLGQRRERNKSEMMQNRGWGNIIAHLQHKVRPQQSKSNNSRG